VNPIHELAVSDIISWDKAIDKKVKTSDDKDVGKVQSITRDYIQTKEGTIGKNYYIFQNTTCRDMMVITSGFHLQKMK
jgi:hypothetical protein